MSNVLSVGMGAHLPKIYVKVRRKHQGSLFPTVLERLLITTAHTMLADLRTSNGSPESASSLNEGDWDYKRVILFCRFWGSEFISSCLHVKYSTHEILPRKESLSLKETHDLIEKGQETAHTHKEAQILQWHCGESDKTHFKSKSIKEEIRKSLYKKKRKELADDSSLKLVQTQ